MNYIIMYLVGEMGGESVRDKTITPEILVLSKNSYPGPNKHDLLLNK